MRAKAFEKIRTMPSINGYISEMSQGVNSTVEKNMWQLVENNGTTEQADVDHISKTTSGFKSILKFMNKKRKRLLER